MSEAVNHPNHYGGDTTYEAIKVIEAWNLDFCLGNAVKYICRAGKKGLRPGGNLAPEMEDLQKARWYLQRRIEQLQSGVTTEARPVSVAVWCNCPAPRRVGNRCHLCHNMIRMAKEQEPIGGGAV